MEHKNSSKEWKFGVAVVTYNRLEMLIECLSCISNQKRRFDHVLLINNCSTDGTTEYLSRVLEAKKYDKLEVINVDKNLGGAGGFKLAIEKLYKKVDYLLLIDDDAMLDPLFLSLIESNIDESIGAYSGTVETNGVIDTSHRRIIKNAVLMTKKNVDVCCYDSAFFEYDLATFCGFMINSEIIKKIGMPKSEYFIWYDDTEYSLRVRKYTKIRNINGARINHKAISSITDRLSWKSYYGYRNAIDMGKNYSKCPLLYVTYRYTYHVYRFIYYKIKSIISRDKSKRGYYKVCSRMNKDVIWDSIHGQLGQSEIYYPGYKF